MSRSVKSGRMSVWKLVFVIVPLGYWVHSATTKWSAQLDDGIAHTFVSTAVSSRMRCRMLDMGCGRYQGPIVLVPSPWINGGCSRCMLVEFRIVCGGEHAVKKRLESLYRNLLNGKLPHNLSWAEAVELVEHLGQVQPHGNDEFVFVVNGQSVFFKKPHTHDLGVEEVSRLRKFLKEAGPSSQAEKPAQPSRMIVVIDHHAAHVYQDFGRSRPADEHKVQPYDPYNFHHHLIHRKEAHYRGERVPEEDSFYEEIAKDITPANEIVLIGHATGKSNAANFLKEYLKTHHPDISRRVIATENADLSPMTEPQMEALAKRHMISVV